MDVGNTHHLKIGDKYFVAIIDSKTGIERSSLAAYLPRRASAKRTDDDFGEDLVYSQRDWINGQGLATTPDSTTTRFSESEGIDASQHGLLKLGPQASLAPIDWQGSVTGCLVPPTGIVRWWSGDNSEYDFIASEALVLSGGMGYAAAQVGNGFSLDGVDDYATPATSRDMPEDTWTIEFWVKPAQTVEISPQNNQSNHASTYCALVDFTLGPDNTPQLGALSYVGTVGVAAGTNGITIYEAYYTFGYAMVPLSYEFPTAKSDWYHVALVYSGSLPSLYVDGVYIKTGINAGLSNSQPPKRLGASQYSLEHSLGHFWAGQIDEYSIYGRSLAALEIQAIYGTGTAGKCKTTDAVITNTGGHLKSVDGHLCGVGPSGVAGHEKQTSICRWDYTHTSGGWAWYDLPAGAVALCGGISHNGKYIVGTVAKGVVNESGGTVAVDSFSGLDNVKSLASDFTLTYGLVDGTDGKSSTLYKVLSAEGSTDIGTLAGVAASPNSLCWHNGKIFALTIGNLTGDPRTILWVYDGTTNASAYKVLPEMFVGHGLASDGAALYIMGQRMTDRVTVDVPGYDTPQAVVQGKLEIYYVEGNDTANDPLTKLVTMGEDTDYRSWSYATVNTPMGLIFAHTNQASASLWLVNGVAGGLWNLATLPAQCNGTVIDSLVANHGKVFVSFRQGKYEESDPSVALPDKFMAYIDFQELVGSGHIDMPYINYGLTTIPKLYRSVFLATPSMDAGSLEVYYSINGNKTVWAKCTFNGGSTDKIDAALQATGFADQFYSTEGYKLWVTDPVYLKAHNLAYRLVFTKEGAVSPVVYVAGLQALQLNETPAATGGSSLWKFTIALAKDTEQLNGRIDKENPWAKLEYLRLLKKSGAVVQMQSITDPEATFNVIVTDITEGFLEEKPGGGMPRVQIEIREV